MEIPITFNSKREQEYGCDQCNGYDNIIFKSQSVGITQANNNILCQVSNFCYRCGMKYVFNFFDKPITYKKRSFSEINIKLI